MEMPHLDCSGFTFHYRYGTRIATGSSTREVTVTLLRAQKVINSQILSDYGPAPYAFSF